MFSKQMCLTPLSCRNSAMTSTEQQDTKPLTIAVVGAMGSGRSALTLRFVQNEYVENFDAHVL